MTHYEVSYKGLSREEADKKAIGDLVEWLSKEQYAALQESVLEMRDDNTRTGPNKIRYINMGLAIAGVTGFPFFAFCRAFMLKEFREWMAEGSDPVPTDEQGFPLETETEGSK